MGKTVLSAGLLVLLMIAFLPSGSHSVPGRKSLIWRRRYCWIPNYINPVYMIVPYYMPRYPGKQIGYYLRRNYTARTYLKMIDKVPPLHTPHPNFQGKKVCSYYEYILKGIYYGSNVCWVVEPYLQSATFVYCPFFRCLDHRFKNPYSYYYNKYCCVPANFESQYLLIFCPLYNPPLQLIRIWLPKCCVCQNMYGYRY